MKKTKILIIFLVVLFLSILGLVLYILLNQLPVSTGLEPAAKENTLTPAISSIGNQTSEVKPQQVQPIVRYDLYLLQETLKLLQEKSWDGNINSRLPLSCEDFDLTRIKQFIERESSKEDDFAIPNELLDIFIPADGVSEVLETRNEYLEYLKSKGVNQKYIEEFDKQTLPSDLDRITYSNAKYSARSSYTAPLVVNGKTDYRRVEMVFYPTDIYIYSRELHQAGILGVEPEDSTERYEYWDKLQDIGIRMLAYHEFTHVLQRSFVFVNSTDFSNTSNYWESADKLLTDAAKKYHWDIGYQESYGKGDFNRIVGEESTAMSVAFEMLVENFDMTQTQAEAMYNASFAGERLSLVRELTDDIQQYFEGEFFGINFTTFVFAQTRISEVFSNCEDQSIAEFVNEFYSARLKSQSNLAASVGYSNMFLNEEMQIFWNMLKN